MTRRRFAGGTLLGIAWSLAIALGTPRAATPSPPFESAIQHPIAVHVTAVDPVRRGATVRVRLDATSRVDLQRAEARLVSAGGASLVGASRARIGRVRPGRPATAEFAVRVPEHGHRFLLQFRVSGEGVAGLTSRGATLNLLPDGPADPGREVTIDGERVIEYRARRIDR